MYRKGRLLDLHYGGKTLLAVAPIVVGICMALCFIFQKCRERNSARSLEDRGWSLARGLANKGNFWIFFSNQKELKNLVRKFLEIEEVCFAFFRDSKGEFLAGGFKDQKKAAERGNLRFQEIPHKPLFTTSRILGGEILEYILPIYMEGDPPSLNAEAAGRGEGRTGPPPDGKALGGGVAGEGGSQGERWLVGAAHIGITKDQVAREMAALNRTILLLTLLLVSGVFGLTVIVVFRLIRPLKKRPAGNEEGVSRISGCPLEWEARGELEVLARNFFALVREIEEYLARIEEENGFLEEERRKQVQEVQNALCKLKAIVSGRDQRLLTTDEKGERKKAAQELREAVLQLKKLEKGKDEFLSFLSSGLKAPLASLRSFSEVLSRHPEEDLETKKEFLNIVSSESERLSRLISEVLHQMEKEGSDSTRPL